MNAIAKLRYKTKVGILLGALLALLLLNSIAGQQSFTRMQQDAASIYEDRLLPSTFLFDIREALYQERLLLSSGVPLTADVMDRLSAHRAEIAGLMRRFEQTALTAEERKEWAALKTGLRLFHRAAALTPESSRQLDESLQRLNKLKAIQAGEGAHLRRELTRIGAASSLQAYAEMALLILTGAVTLSLIGFSRNVFDPPAPHRPSLN